jgi:6-pyruvoyltetrahydropterin/6-carboxytetrahydropterin synthase
VKTYTVRVNRESLGFSAGHFITFENGDCERLHGHNYRVGITIEAPLGDAGYVLDFLALREAAQAITARLDHRVLIPLNHPVFQLTVTHESVTVVWRQKTWVFPREDCILLPITNSTTELIADWYSDELVKSLGPMIAGATMSIEIEENFGFAATVKKTINL